MAEDVYSAETIAACKQDLIDLAQEPRTHFNKREAVAALFEAIEEALVNHTYAEVAQRLGKSGLTISAGSLKQYMLKLKRERSGNSKKTSGSSKRKREGNTKRIAEKPLGQTPTSSKPTTRVLPDASDEVTLAY
ncbi:hypothetical protein N836_26080 [Leptolyngbya sp. Heron Island J]|nr:hypothetical protein N836_26080 [Leptolyngbya sp. Heron Island J]